MENHSPVQYYAPDQIIFRGQQGDIDGVVQRVQTALSIRLGIVEPTPLDLSVLPPYTAGEVLAAYEIDGAATPEQVATQVLRYGTAVAPSYNYFIGCPPIPTAGDPWGVEGSPWGVEGSPWGVEGSPGTGGLQAARDDFLTQWALGPQGIHLHDGNGNRRTDHVGEGVCVGVFDTAPFPVGTVTIDWAPALLPPNLLELHVEHPQWFYQPSVPSAAPHIDDHGLFAAGLIYAAAPASKIYLIRVLDEYGQGDALTLAAALLEWSARMVAARDENQLAGAVINLSLGIPSGAPTTIGPVPLEDCVSMLSQRIARAGLTVVAAAGNDSWALPVSQLKPAQLPARDELVVGVQASHIGGGRACFSNLGDIAAPGCGLLSLTRKAENPEEAAEAGTPFGYAYWSGTSFATALVSGLAALLSERSSWDPGPVVGSIHQAATTSCDATLPGGIAKLPAGL